MEYEEDEVLESKLEQMVLPVSPKDKPWIFGRSWLIERKPKGDDGGNYLNKSKK